MGRVLAASTRLLLSAAALGLVGGCLGTFGGETRWQLRRDWTTAGPAGRAEAERACDAGSAAACRVAADVYDLGIEVPVSKERALAWWRKGCAGDASQCARAQQAELSAARIRAITWACEAEQDVSRCSLAGLSYLDTRGADVDLPRARALFELGCAADSHPPNSDDPCIHLGMMRLLGMGGDVDGPGGVKVLTGAAAASGRAAVFVGLAHELGLGVAPDLDEARRRYDAACPRVNHNWGEQGDAFACFRRAVLLETGPFAAEAGVTTAEDGLREAARFYSRACLSSLRFVRQSACLSAGRLVLRVGTARMERRWSGDELNEADGLLRAACFAGSAAGCKELRALAGQMERDRSYL